MDRSDRPASRRSIVAAGLAGAVLPAFGRPAWADDGPTAGEIDIPLVGGHIGGIRAVPVHAGPYPCVIVAGDEAGRPEWIAEVCRRLARRGTLAVAPDLWAADHETPDQEVMRRLDAAFSWGREHDGDAGRMTLVGFGRGGRVTWLYAAQSQSLKAAVAWGGAVGGAPSSSRPKTPLDVAGQLQAPLLGLYGKDDVSNSRELLLRAESRAHAAGRTAEIIVYVGADAGFAGDGRSSGNKAAAQDGWDRMLAWFHRYGAA